MLNVCIASAGLSIWQSVTSKSSPSDVSHLLVIPAAVVPLLWVVVVVVVGHFATVVSSHPLNLFLLCK
jgi:hypothetical protein